MKNALKILEKQIILIFEFSNDVIGNYIDNKHRNLKKKTGF